MSETSDRTMPEHNPANCQGHECEICKVEKPFHLPKEIISAYKEGNLVIFAGAGISTESSSVYDFSLKDLVKSELGIPEQENMEFSKLMSLYCEKPRSRKDLLRIIKERIDYVREYRELYYFATKFHRSLSTIPHLNDIITTNWDDFFERECNATPIVTGQDFAVFQNVGGRRVFKLHGSIYNYGSIVATEEDYIKCYQRLSTGIIGANLKVLLMSKTLVFVGFSFQDNDFQRLYRLLKKDVSGLIPPFFVVTLEEDAQGKLDRLHINATAITTDATFFLQKFKEGLLKDNLMLSEDNFNKILKIKEAVREAYNKLSTLDLGKYPDATFMYFYNDGLQHTVDYLLDNKKSGVNSCKDHLVWELSDMSHILENYLAKDNYLDAAYAKGRRDALKSFIFSMDDRLPVYYIYGYDKGITDFKEYSKLLTYAEKFNSDAHKVAKEHIGANYPAGLIPHHAPFI